MDVFTYCLQTQKYILFWPSSARDPDMNLLSIHPLRTRISFECFIHLLSYTLTHLFVFVVLLHTRNRRTNVTRPHFFEMGK